MADPSASGNQAIARDHWLRRLTAVVVLIAGALAVCWVNLGHVAASYRPDLGGTGFAGTVRAMFSREEMGGWIALLQPFQRAAFPWGVRSFMLYHPSPAHLAWMDWWGYAAQHAAGAPAAPARGFADRLHEIGLNMVLFLGLAVLPAVLLSDAVGRRLMRGAERRPGTAEWAPPADLRPYARAVGQPGSLPLGRVAGRLPGAGQRLAVPLRDAAANISRFSHATVWGVTEAGKTSGVYKPWMWTDLLLNDPSLRDPDGRVVGAMSSVAIDMKHPDLFNAFAPYAAALPRRFLLLAPGDPDRSMHYNPLDFVLDADGRPRMDDIALLSDAIVPNVPTDATGVSFHRGNEHRFADNLMQYVCEVQWALDRGVAEARDIPQRIEELVRPHLNGLPMPRLRSLPMVAHLVRSDPESLLTLILGTVTDPAVPDAWPSRIAQFVEEGKGGTVRPDRNTAGWLQDLVTRFGVFAVPGVAQISDHSQFSLDVVGRQPTTLIIGMPPTSTQSLASYSALIITQLLLTLRQVAGASGRRLPIPVTVYLDELANQGRIPRLEEDLATTRDLGIACVLGIQNTAQLEDRYGQRVATSMISNTNTKIVLGRNLGFEDAEKFARATGDTTVLAASASEGARGGSRGQSETRRTFMTADQIRGMRAYEALVFLQNGKFTRTVMTPFHRMVRALRQHHPDARYLDGATSPEGHRVPPGLVLLHRHLQLNGALGHWDQRPSRHAPPSSTSPSTVPTERGAASAVAEIADRARREPAATNLGRDASLDGTASPEEAGGEPASDERVRPPHPNGVGAGNPGATVPAPEDAAARMLVPTLHRATDAHPAPDRPEALRAPEPPSATTTDGRADDVAPADDWGTVSAFVGLFNAIARGKLAPPDAPRIAPPGWRLALPSGDHALVRWEYVQAYGDRGRTRPEDLIQRWRRAGFVLESALAVDDGGARTQAIAFVPEALGRLTGPVAAAVAAWPKVPVDQVGGLEPAASPRGPAGNGATARGPAPTAGQAPPATAKSTPRKSDPDEALRAVIAWAQVNRAALRTRPSQEIGMWEDLVQNELALLIPQHYLTRLMMRRGFDYRAIVDAWRASGVLIAPEKQRFTVYVRLSGDGEQRGARFVAFRWDRLEAAGLARE
jgi:hypothetical protein